MIGLVAKLSTGVLTLPRESGCCVLAMFGGHAEFPKLVLMQLSIFKLYWLNCVNSFAGAKLCHSAHTFSSSSLGRSPSLGDRVCFDHFEPPKMNHGDTTRPEAPRCQCMVIFFSDHPTTVPIIGASLLSIITHHSPLSTIIIKHSPRSTVKLHHYQPLSTIFHHYQPLFTIISHYQPSLIIFNHYSPLTIKHHHYQASSHHNSRWEPWAPSQRGSRCDAAARGKNSWTPWHDN